MKCDACGFFDCGRDCRCRCHPHDWTVKKPRPKTIKAWDKASEAGAMEGLSSLFG